MRYSTCELAPYAILLTPKAAQRSMVADQMVGILDDGP